ncbi:MAG: metallophosphoesterase [Acidiferrobacterales bacterium]|nr:metallophosphoesterase [Acidiferrobacterales bacterium]
MKDRPKFFTRRSVFKMAGLSGIALGAYSFYRGLRFPVLSWESGTLDNKVESEGVQIQFSDLINTTKIESPALSFRAYAPEPNIHIASPTDNTLKISVNNLSPDARLSLEGAQGEEISEDVVGITRNLTVSLTAGAPLTIKWQLAKQESYRFAAIGDTGGDKELGWCIQRAHDLGARFLLHLGDFNYQEGDYDNAIQQFNQAPLPCYVSIGNHDFNESGLVYKHFLNAIGPLNNAFSIGKTRFINLDTAASFLPYSGGQRGKLIDELIADPVEYSDNVVFTHRPLHDPQPEEAKQEGGDHDLGSIGETNWLIKSLKTLGANTLLSGHIHIFDRSEYQGIENIIVGQGLGHQDLIVNDISFSKLAIGSVSQNGKVSYDFAPLEMPMDLHCHPRIQVVKDSLMNSPHAQTIKQIEGDCSI